MLKLKNIRHVPKLKRNLISVGQLADAGMKITFDDLCKITKGAMISAHGKERRCPLHDVRLYNFNFSCIIGCR